MKSGFVSIVGRPNVGKSTLLNKVLNYRVSITTPKPQTTRDAIKGIFNDEESQIVFVDTPGIHKPKQKLGESLNQSSYKSFKDADLILFLQPLDEKIGPGDKNIIEKIIDKNAVAVISKLDMGDPELAKERAGELKTLGFKEVLGVSDSMASSINHLLSFIKESLPEGEPYYNREDVTDVSMRFMAKEMIREAAINNVTDEIPHSLGVVIDNFNEEDESLLKIDGTIFVERESQKGILVGKQGAMIKKISTEARLAMEQAFGVRVYLKVRIKVNKNWTENERQIKRLGY